MTQLISPRMTAAFPPSACRATQLAAPGSFFWGAGGRMVSPQERKEQSPDFSPGDHWTQGMARVANAMVDSIDQRQQQFQGVPGGGRVSVSGLKLCDIAKRLRLR